MLQMTGASLQEIYDRSFFAAQIEGSSRSAAVIAPLILKLFPGASSVTDVGCGTGVWLHHFKANGIARVLGLDGGAPDDGQLLLRHDEYRRVNLAKPLRSSERFDLAISLEVAEHLPASAAKTFIGNLCSLSDAVIFSAAIPGQGGTHHINERWQSYWTDMFEEHGYIVLDLLRPQIWYDHRVEWWYAQNMLVFVKSERRDIIEPLEKSIRQPVLDVIHPRCFEIMMASLEHHRKITIDLNQQIRDQGQVTHQASSVEVESLQARIFSLETHLTSIMHSTSWRITGPIRRLMNPYPRLRSALRRSFAPIWKAARRPVRARLGAKQGVSG